jgi:hypothetical protein
MPPGLSLPCGSYSGYDTPYITHAFCRTHVMSMSEKATIADHSPYQKHKSAATKSTMTSRHATRIQADRVRRQITQLAYFVQAGRGFNSTTQLNSTQLIGIVIVHDIQPVVDGRSSRPSSPAPDHFEAFPNDASRFSAASLNYMSVTGHESLASESDSDRLDD